MENKDIEQYKKTMEVRKESYSKHISEMFVDPRIKDWATRMKSKTGEETVKVWHNVLPWLEALMVVRYGEAIEHWPKGTSVDDYERALKWESEEKIPLAVTRGLSMNLGE